jgi:hypothetical protein
MNEVDLVGTTERLIVGRAFDLLWEVPLLTCGRSSRKSGNSVVTGF